MENQLFEDLDFVIEELLADGYSEEELLIALDDPEFLEVLNEVVHLSGLNAAHNTTKKPDIGVDKKKKKKLTETDVIGGVEVSNWEDQVVESRGQSRKEIKAIFDDEGSGDVKKDIADIQNALRRKARDEAKRVARQRAKAKQVDEAHSKHQAKQAAAYHHAGRSDEADKYDSATAKEGPKLRKALNRYKRHTQAYWAARKLLNPDIKDKWNEEVEQVDELDKKIDQYLDRTAFTAGDPNKKRRERRTAGRRLALKKRWADPKYGFKDNPKVPQGGSWPDKLREKTEHEAEQIDEKKGKSFKYTKMSTSKYGGVDLRGPKGTLSLNRRDVTGNLPKSGKSRREKGTAFYDETEPQGEQIDEISAGKLGSYVVSSKKDEKKREARGEEVRKKIQAASDTGKLRLTTGKIIKGGRFTPPYDRKLSGKASREEGRKRALKKLTGSARVNASEYYKEEAEPQGEQIDETVRKWSDDKLKSHLNHYEKMTNNRKPMLASEISRHRQIMDEVSKRKKGKKANEETEQVDEILNTGRAWMKVRQALRKRDKKKSDKKHPPEMYQKNEHEPEGEQMNEGKSRQELIQEIKAIFEAGKRTRQELKDKAKEHKDTAAEYRGDLDVHGFTAKEKKTDPVARSVSREAKQHSKAARIAKAMLKRGEFKDHTEHEGEQTVEESMLSAAALEKRRNDYKNRVMRSLGPPVRKAEQHPSDADGEESKMLCKMLKGNYPWGGVSARVAKTAMSRIKNIDVRERGGAIKAVWRDKAAFEKLLKTGKHK